MTDDISYFVEEKLLGHYRAIAVSVCDDFVMITISLDNDVHLEISLDELKFIARAAGTLPDWLKSVDGIAGPSRPSNGAPVVKSTIKGPPPAAQAAPAPVAQGPMLGQGDEKAPRHGKRWAEEEDKKLLAAFFDAQQTVVEIARAFGRSPSSIVSRLLHLDVIEIIPKR